MNKSVIDRILDVLFGIACVSFVIYALCFIINSFLTQKTIMGIAGIVALVAVVVLVVLDIVSAKIQK